ncbi:MAG: PQQ-binding-like beta-propeller repeat protein [Lentisphaeria bacterium]|nr:PQQ-binding-like beta-propeller repeat protein [Lentisphaeria bacterium]
MTFQTLVPLLLRVRLRGRAGLGWFPGVCSPSGRVRGWGRCRARGQIVVAAVACLVCGAAWPQGGMAPGPVLQGSVEEFLAESGFQGGLVVQVGLRDASTALALAEKPNVWFHGLVRESGILEAVREEIREAGLYGRVSAMGWEGPALPYADGMVNLLLVLNEEPPPDTTEVDRVLAPLGAAGILRGGVFTLQRKAWSGDMDEWTHSRYDASGNAVSRDRSVGPPRSLRWEASPRWNHGVKTSSLVSARGRLFAILDDTHFSSSARVWSLVARDAFNGIELWRHELPGWGGARGGKKVGPAQLNRRLVAVGERVYAPLGDSVPVSVLDAATGTPLRVLEGTANVEEFLFSEGVLVALVHAGGARDFWRGADRSMRLVAVDPGTGRPLWDLEAGMVLPLTLAADGTRVVYHDGRTVQSLDLRTGVRRWTSVPTGQQVAYRDQASPDSPGAERSTIMLAPQFAPTMVLYGDVVAFAGGRQLNVFSAADGKELWRAEYPPSNYSVPVDLFGFDGLLWGPDVGMNLWRPLDDNLDVNAYDPLTGEIRRSVRGKYGFRFQHHRCHQMKVVGKAVIGGRAGVEFLDTETGALTAHHWARGSCFYGVLPANGLLYLPPHDCACYIRAKLSGFLALSAASSRRTAEIPSDRRLRPGPAYGQTATAGSAAGPEDWPTYRHDAARSGRSPTKVDTELLLGWQTPLGGRLSSPVVADNRVFLGSMDGHRLHALDAATGEIVWQASLDAGVDSPPTVHGGLVLCGCRDGSVQALRAADGVLAWRFLACPAERLILSRGRIESVWPVHGSVLVVGDTVYFVAGRSSYLDGGLHLYGLELHSGREVLHKVLSSRGPDGSQCLDEEGVDGFLNDILSSNGERIFLRHQVLDFEGNGKAERISHLHGPDGYLSFETTSRLLWTYAPLYSSPHQGAFYDVRLSRALFPSGRILVEDADVLYGFGQNHYDKMRVEPGGTWALFAAAKENGVPLDLSAVEYRKLALSGQKSVRFAWWTRVPLQVWAMVRTRDALFAAGPRGTGTVSEAAFEGRGDASLLAVSPEDGKVLAQMSLPGPPVWDGLAAAGGNLVLSLLDGSVVCLWPAASGRPGKPLSPGAWGSVLPPVQLAPEPGLIGRWRFDEGVGLLARDASGRGHDAQVSGSWGAGEFGTCLVTHGAPNAAVIPDAPHLRFGNESFTLALWVKTDSHGVRLLGKEAFPENWWVINVLDQGQAELVLGEGRDTGRSVRAKTTVPLATDAWIHLVAEVDRLAREVRWYLNGALDSRHPIPETMTDGLHAAGADIAIPSSHKPFRGLVGDIRIYGRALGPERARELYGEGAAHYRNTAFRVIE